MGLLHCPYLGCQQHLSVKTELLQHYLTEHPASTWRVQLLEILSDEKFDATETSLAGDSKMMKCVSCQATLEESQYSQHCSLHSEPGEMAQCRHCLLFMTQSEVDSHSSPGHCQHYQERERIQELAS